MKLEEVLPAMREGRVARYVVDETLWRMNPDGRRIDYQSPEDGIWYSSAIPPLDGWRLEPEPPTKWPKGSVQWAYEKAGPNGRIARRSDPTCVYHTGLGNALLIKHSLALDWEAVK